MSSKQQIEKDRERIAELYKIIREKKHNYDLAIEALVIASKYLNKADNQRMELALLKPYEEIVRCKDCKHKVVTVVGEYNPQDIVCSYWASDGLTENDFCSYAERMESDEE